MVTIDPATHTPLCLSFGNDSQQYDDAPHRRDGGSQHHDQDIILAPCNPCALQRQFAEATSAGPNVIEITNEPEDMGLVVVADKTSKSGYAVRSTSERGVEFSAVSRPGTYSGEGIHSGDAVLCFWFWRTYRCRFEF